MQKACYWVSAILAFILVVGIIHSWVWLSKMPKDPSQLPPLTVPDETLAGK